MVLNSVFFYWHTICQATITSPDSLVRRLWLLFEKKKCPADKRTINDSVPLCCGPFFKCLFLDFRVSQIPFVRRAHPHSNTHTQRHSTALENPPTPDPNMTRLTLVATPCIPPSKPLLGATAQLSDTAASWECRSERTGEEEEEG